MELELGLALPDHHSRMLMKGLDLNSCSNEMEIEKGKKGDYSCNIRRNLSDEEEIDSKSLSLLLWSGQPNGGDDEGRKWRNLHVDDEESDGDEETVGWPPISSLRRELLHRHHHHHRRGGGGVGAVAAPVRNSTYVKVKMEGVPIGRKINLRVYHSYQALTHSLINMFAKYIENDNRSGGNYTILYQDKEGDWMLAGDVPWETFVESVRRVEIQRNGS
ncbi:auxin-responsive protein IAA29-like [Salvia miltiorrhiza]|uniref:auxin-responsive protein IAA29-like n=1 Tax=Salvia miltiorrhiza TaxID=226208 RepID=UPI0025AC504D|nr:auxin-responsive protein IAA29-like [Salvia miltiorrhiza]